MFAPLSALMRVSATEALGHPAAMLFTFAAAGGTLLSPLFQFQRFSEDGRLARDCGLATALLLGLILAVGCAGHLRRTLTDGTSAIAFAKALPRGVWLCGRTLGAWLCLSVGLLTQGAAVLLAEAHAPKYHAGASFADVRGVLLDLAFLLLALLVAAANSRFRSARFALTASLAMPLLLWARVLALSGIHWGTLSALVAIAFLLLQLSAFALLLSLFVSTGFVAGITLALLMILFLFFNGSAFLPLDALSGGGYVPAQTLLLLLPQTLLLTLFLLWLGTFCLNHREV